MGRRPHHSMVCISATSGLESMTIEHIGISLYLNVPLIIVITKIDCICKDSTAEAESSRISDSNCEERGGTKGRGEVLGEEQLPPQVAQLVQRIRQLLLGPRREAQIISSEQQLSHFLEEQWHFGPDSGPGSSSRSPLHVDESQSPARGSNIQVPIFLTSSVSGVGLDLLCSYLYQLPSHENKHRTDSLHQPLRLRLLGSIGRTDATGTTEPPSTQPGTDQTYLTPLPGQSSSFIERQKDPSRQ